MSDFFDSYGPAFLGLQLIRLYDKIDQGGDMVIRRSTSGLPSRVASSLVYLRHYGPATVSELVKAIGASHQLVSQRVATLFENDLITKIVDQSDRRRTLVSLNHKGRSLAKQIDGLCQTGNDVYRGLFEEIGVDLNASVIRLRKAFEERSLEQRFADHDNCSDRKLRKLNAESELPQPNRAAGGRSSECNLD